MEAAQDRKEMRPAEFGKAMYDYILNSFSNRHEVSRQDGDIHIISPKGLFVVKTFSKEAITGSSDEVRKALEEIVKENQAQDIATSFVFMRCFTDYDERRNHGAFLKQSWDKDKTGKSDNWNTKKITKLERAVEAMYDNGVDREGYKSRLVYFSPKTNILVSVRLRENSPQHWISGTMGYICNWRCVRNLYAPGEMIDHQKCKTEKQCTLYARGRDKREVRVAELSPPLKMEVYRKGGLFLAEIR